MIYTYRVEKKVIFDVDIEAEDEAQAEEKLLSGDGDYYEWDSILEDYKLAHIE